MAGKKTTMVLCLVGLGVLFNMAAADDTTAPTAYVNHTVGGDAGWFFNATTNTTSANYSAWAANQTFNLGDYLIFNTNTNQTAIQTYNETTYKSCNTDDALDSDTFYYWDGNNEFGKPQTLAVPLTIEGTQYYFSDVEDGVQCQNGMAFEIKVGHGLGLPPSLNQPPPPAYVPPPVPAEDGESPPISVVANPPSAGTSVGATMTLLVSVLAMLASHLA